VPSINEEIRERRASLVDVQRVLHDVDTTLEQMQRFLTRVRARKQYLPDAQDAERLNQMSVTLAERTMAVQQQLSRTVDVFRF
jgi:hypothetical protein